MLSKFFTSKGYKGQINSSVNEAFKLVNNVSHRINLIFIGGSTFVGRSAVNFTLKTFVKRKN